MQYTKLGRTGLSVSRLCLGTMNFGPQTGEDDSHAIMDKALELGINFFDTADIYGWKIGEGWTEAIMGRWYAKGGGRRDKTVLATKCYNRMGDWPNERGLSAFHIKRACEGSLRRMQTDHIDLYQMHHVERSTPWDEIWEAMEQLRREGKITYVGSSNFAGWDIATGQQLAQQRHFLGLVSEQSIYNAENRWVELEVVPACKHYGLGLIPWSPLAGGLLAGVLEKQSAGRRAGEGIQKQLEKKRESIQGWEDLARQLGHRPADMGIAWLLKNPVVTAPIIGPRTVDQVVGSLKALEIQLDDAAMKRIDELFPNRPAGAAPEAYAW